MGTNLTPQQQAALSAHDRSVSLAAGAGCGKTFVLTERYLSYLDPSQPEPTAQLAELVAITFTDAAAREMRDRIRRRCHQRLESAEGERQRSAWKQVIASLDGARISTIHSFCATLLRNYAAEAALDPRFELLDPPTAQLLRLRSLDDHLRQLLVARDERLIQLATHFGLRSLRDTIAELLGDNVQPMLLRWAHTEPEALAAHWQQHYDQQIVPAALGELAGSEPVTSLQQLCVQAAGPSAKLQNHLSQLGAALAALPHEEQPSRALERLRGLAMTRGVCTKKDWSDPDDFETYKTSCTAVRSLLGKSLVRRPLSQPAMQEAAQRGLELLELVGQVLKRYDLAKQQRNVLEFDDLIAKTQILLSDPRYPQVQQQVARSTQLLMVDEFQDTDPSQVAIVQALCGKDWAERGLFVVGDFKQSIYRFRGAEPRVSSALRETLPPESRLSLTTNFRSQPAILDFVNALFHDAFAEGYQPLVAHRPQVAPTPAVEFLWSLPGASDDSHDPRLGRTARARSEEARFIARRLAQLLDSGEHLVADTDASGEPTARPLALGDIAILLRSLSDVALYEEALREYGLDYYLAGGHAFYAQQEIYDVLHLLRAIASPVDELSLAGALRSPLFALHDETLFWLVEASGSLNASLRGETLPEQLSEAERAKVLRAAATIERLRQQKDQLLVAELLSEAIAATGYDAILLTEFLGHRKWANVQKLLDQARALDRTRPGDLNGFVTQLSEFVVRAPKEPLAATRAEGEVIRIMTIHYAKGLEFPLVVVPDLDRPHYVGAHGPVLDAALGPLVPATEKEDVVGWDLHRFAEQQQEREERKRLLYVACTRAADYLLLSSSVTDLDKPKSAWMKLLGEHFQLSDGSCLSALPSGYAVPQIRVTTTPPATTRKPASPARGVDLKALLEQTNQLAQAGQGVVPGEVAPIPADPRARRRFSFSKLSGELRGEGRGARSEEVATSKNGDETAVETAVESSAGNRKETDALGLGTLVHAVLERTDFAKPGDDLLGLCEFLAPQFVADGWQAAAGETAELVGNFLKSPRAAELAAAQAVHREVEFYLPWPPGQPAGEPTGEKTGAGVYLHGLIDCLYQDAGGEWHLLDYKSNHCTAAGVPPLAERYALQMFVYRLACEQVLGAPPAECVLHFLRPQQEFACSWNDALRAEWTQTLQEAMTRQLTPQRPRQA